MKKIAAILVLAFPMLAIGQALVVFDESTGAIQAPTNFFAANSNLLKSAMPWSSVNGRGSTGSRPTAASANFGYLYANTDIDALERSDGSSWVTIATIGGASTNTPTLTGSNTFTGPTNTFTGTLSIDSLEVTDYSATRTNLHLVPGVDVHAYDSDLGALAALAFDGMIARTGSGSVAARTITGTSGRLTVSNGTGISGNPTLDIDTNSLSASINAGVPNGSGSWLHWSMLVGVPAGFADNTDDGSGGGGGGSPAGSDGDIQTKNGTNFNAIASPSGFKYMGSMINWYTSGAPSYMNPIFDGGWVFLDEMIGDPTANYAGGREMWTRTVNGTGSINQAPQEQGVFGAWRIIVTNATASDRVAMVAGDGSNKRGMPIVGFSHVLMIERTRIRNLNTQGSEEARLWTGLMDATSLGISTEPAHGIYLRVTNNVWQGVTASNSVYTVSTGPSVVADDYPYVGWYFSGASNVVFFHGLTAGTIAPFGTNTATIPAPTTGTVYSHVWAKVVGAASTLTNNLDKVGIYVRP